MLLSDTRSSSPLGTACKYENARQFGNDPHGVVNHLKIDGDGCLSCVVSGPVAGAVLDIVCDR